MTHYVWEGSKVLGEYNGSTGAAQVAYWYAGERLFMKTGATTQVFLRDRLSVRLTLSDIGAVVGRQAHLPYGEDFAESGTQQKQHFTSYERDNETGTDYAINRQYNQSVGRFSRVDPYSGSNDFGHPQSLNRYSYVMNDPIGLSDPSGLENISPLPGGGWPWLEGSWHLPSVPVPNPYPDNGGWFTNIPTPQIDTDELLKRILDLITKLTEQVPVNYTDESDRVYEFFANHVNCESYFLGQGIYDQFLAKAEGAKYIDFYLDPYNAYVAQNHSFINVGLFSVPGLLFFNIDATFAVIGYAAAWWVENTIAFGSAFYGGGGPKMIGIRQLSMSCCISSSVGIILSS